MIRMLDRAKLRVLWVALDTAPSESAARRMVWLRVQHERPNTGSIYLGQRRTGAVQQFPTGRMDALSYSQFGGEPLAGWPNSRAKVIKSVKPISPSPSRSLHKNASREQSEESG